MKDLIISKSLRDFLTFKMVGLAVLPLIVGIFFWGFVFLEAGSWLYNSLSAPLEGFFEGSEAGFLLTVINFFIAAFVYLLIFVLYLLSVIITNAFIAGFYSPLIATMIQKKHYPNIMIEGFGGVMDFVGFFAKTLGVFLMLLIIAIPLYFIPVVGFLTPMLIFFWFFKKNMVFDMGSTILSKNEYDEIVYKDKNKINTISLVAYLSSYIPIFNYFAGVFQLIVYAHLFFILKKDRALRV